MNQDGAHRPRFGATVSRLAHQIDLAAGEASTDTPAGARSVLDAAPHPLHWGAPTDGLPGFTADQLRAVVGDRLVARDTRIAALAQLATRGLDPEPGAIAELLPTQWHPDDPLRDVMPHLGVDTLVGLVGEVDPTSWTLVRHGLAGRRVTAAQLTALVGGVGAQALADLYTTQGGVHGGWIAATSSLPAHYRCLAVVYGLAAGEHLDGPTARKVFARLGERAESRLNSDEAGLWSLLQLADAAFARHAGTCDDVAAAVLAGSPLISVRAIGAAVGALDTGQLATLARDCAERADLAGDHVYPVATILSANRLDDETVRRVARLGSLHPEWLLVHNTVPAERLVVWLAGGRRDSTLLGDWMAGAFAANPYDRELLAAVCARSSRRLECSLRSAPPQALEDLLDLGGTAALRAVVDTDTPAARAVLLARYGEYDAEALEALLG